MEKKLTAETMAEKVLELTEHFNRYIFDHPEILDHIPDQAMLVFLDANDPAFSEANLELANASPESPGRQRVYIRMQKHIRLVEQVGWEAKILPSPQLA
ncbi:MAG TPA: DUF5647 family protein [Anaerolineales bacterium]|nr:DUF5647 family protein [Anaerolineales bacterium]